MRSIDATHVKDVSLLNPKPGFIIKVHEDTTGLICNQTLGDGIFFCLEAGLLINNNKDEFNIVLFFGQLIDFMGSWFCPSNQAICFLKGDGE